MLSFVGCSWRLVEGDEEGVGCVEAETPRLGGGDENDGDGTLGLAGMLRL